MRWLDNSLMVADTLTKVSAERGYLLDCIENNAWSAIISTDGIAAKDRIRAARHARAAALRQQRQETSMARGDRRGSLDDSST